ncbi:MAG TPA: response regulator [Thermomicrobiales bacterium]|nr:response regulator [Thermomicrobiales bacterium]
MTTRPLIAVVDDDRVYTEMIRDFLDGEGYDTVLLREASTAVEAIVRARPALALLDMRMDVPQSGVAILADLRANPATSSLPVIICTADQQFLRTHAAELQRQNAAFVAKPFDLDVLLNVIEQTLAGHDGC